MKDADQIECPVCGRRQRFTVSKGGAYWYLRCACGAVSKIPRPKDAK